MRCSECNTSISEGDLFCRSCGASLKNFHPVQEETLIEVSKSVAHRLNNALSIVLTNSQLAVGQLASLPEETSEKIRTCLKDIVLAAADSGPVIHQFQRFLDSLADGRPQKERSAYVAQITSNLQLPSSTKPRVFTTGLIGTRIPSAQTRVRQISVLIVDDEEKIRHALSYALSLGGHHVITASNGNEVLNLLKSSAYDIAFVDLKMPDMDGWEVANAIKRANSDTKVVLMTGWRVKLDDDRLKESSVDTVITKPFELSEIADLISTVTVH